MFVQLKEGLFKRVLLCLGRLIDVNHEVTGEREQAHKTFLCR